MKKGVVYYTDNILKEPFAKMVRGLLKKSVDGIPIVWVSQKPIDEENNLVWENIGRSHKSMCIQILSGIQNLNVDVIYLAEHDVIYHPSHFGYIPKKSDVFYYNLNRWWLEAETGRTSFRHNVLGALSQLVAHKKLLESHYKERVTALESGLNVRLQHGTEPGKQKGNILTNYETETFCSEWPNIDIRHKRNFTYSDRFKKRKYILADGIPYWGKTKGRYDKFIKELFDVTRILAI